MLCMIAGNVVFHGPRDNVVPHFQSLGFFVPERKAVSDFLQEVTSQKDQQVGAFVSCYAITNAWFLTLHDWANQVANVKDTWLQVGKWSISSLMGMGHLQSV